MNREGKSTIDVPEEYVGLVLGNKDRNKERIETKSETKINVSFRKKAKAQGGDTTKFEIFGPPENRVRAEWLIRDRIISWKDKMIRRELGGDVQFVCVDVKDKNGKFQLKRDGNFLILDYLVQSQGYRIVIDDFQNEISVQTISEIKNHLSTSLEELNTKKEGEKLIADLCCHFGKALVYNVIKNVNEDETVKTFTPVDLDRRLMKIVSNSKNERAKYWGVAFEEGVDPSVKDALPESEDDLHRFPRLKLIHTQWRYDFGFGTPSCRSVRLKAWKGLRHGPPGIDDKPPDEVKNILTPVVFQAEKDIKAWICYPSVNLLRGEIMTPNSPYDCKIKLRTGSRYVTDKDSVCLEEDAILSDYLSHCKLDKKDGNVTLCLPDEKDHEIPKGFGCIFYRKAEERIFSTTDDEEECFTVIVSDKKGWDSDGVDKREQKQFDIRVVMNSWSEALLSPEQDWTPEEIVAKLDKYMDFLSSLKSYLFDDL